MEEFDSNKREIDRITQFNNHLSSSYITEVAIFAMMMLQASLFLFCFFST